LAFRSSGARTATGFCVSNPSWIAPEIEVRRAGSGRYATPRTAEKWEQKKESFRALEPPTGGKGRLLQRPIPFGWPEFDRLYRIVAEQLSALERVSGARP